MGLINQIKAAFGGKTGRMEISASYSIKSQITTRPIIADLDERNKKIVIFGTKEGRLVALKGDKVEWAVEVCRRIGCCRHKPRRQE